MNKRNNPYYKYLGAEDKIQASIVQYLEYKHPDILFFHPTNEGKRTTFERFKAKLLGIKSGVSDIIILDSSSGYNGMAMEVKSEKGKLTENQKNFLEQCEKRNYYTCVVYSLEEAISHLDFYFKIAHEFIKERIKKNQMV